MSLFRKRKGIRELQIEVEEARQSTEAVKEKSNHVERLRAELQNHLKQNHFGPRLYAQMVQNWKR
jgi:hypothetical protein